MLQAQLAIHQVEEEVTILQELAVNKHKRGFLPLLLLALNCQNASNYLWHFTCGI